MPLGKYNPPILARIVALVAVSVAAALAAMLFITFRGPPPRPAPVEISNLVEMINRPWGRWISTQDRDVEVRLQKTFVPPDGLKEDRALARTIAHGTRLSPADVLAYSDSSGTPLLQPQAKGAEPLLGSGPPTGMRGEFAIAVKRPNGWQTIRSAHNAATSRWLLVTLSAMAAIFVGLLIPTYFVARHIARPIMRLAAHAGDHEPTDSELVPVTGPPETRRLSQAFNAMQSRLSGYVEERTAMLAAIAHDLRTPLTRLSFRLDGLSDAAREKAEADVMEMREMIASVLDFMRGSAAPFEMKRIDATALVETLVDDLSDMGNPVRLNRADRVIMLADGQALRRCLCNIIENALRYAGDAEISIAMEGESARFTLCDHGPGIAAEHMAHIFDPFYRGEQSRNRSTGGVGLGMAIAKNIVERHGGEISLANRMGGGLKVEMIFPVADATARG